MDRRVKSGGDEGIGPRIGDKLLDARHKIGYKDLRISLTEGRIPDAILTAERVRMPARSRKPFPGGPGAPVGRQKDRSVRSVLNARQLCGVPAKHRAAASCGNPGLGLSHRGDSRRRVPWRSAGRRARLSLTIPASRRGGEERRAAAQAAIGETMRLSALRLPSFVCWFSYAS
jgi:hypothetical protein